MNETRAPTLGAPCGWASASDCVAGRAKKMQPTPVGFESTRGDPIGLAGRRLNHSAKVSLHLAPGASAPPTSGSDAEAHPSVMGAHQPAAAAAGTWCSGITSAPHVEGPGFNLNPQCVHIWRQAHVQTNNTVRWRHQQNASSNPQLMQRQASQRTEPKKLNRGQRRNVHRGRALSNGLACRQAAPTTKPKATTCGERTRTPV